MDTSEWVVIAVLGKTRGNRGEITAIPLSSKLDRFDELAGRPVYLFGDGKAYDVEETWWHDAKLIFKFRGIDSINDAEALQGSEVRLPVSERVTLDEGEYFESDLVGCQVATVAGKVLGRVTALTDGGGPSGLLELDSGLLIPFARRICTEIDPGRKIITVDLPEGLEDLNRP